MSSRWKNAADVLPPELLAEVQRVVGYHSTGLWVPGAKIEGARARARRVLDLRAQGVETSAIAADVGLTERRVQQIIAKAG